MFSGLKASLAKFSQKTKEIITEKELTSKDLRPLIENLKIQLLKNNLSFEVAEKITTDLEENLEGKIVKKKETENFVKNSLKNILKQILTLEKIDLEKFISERRPALLLFMGFNGCGKTTTIAKIAYKFKDKFKVVLAAGDTFRAASIEQLEIHAKRLGLKLIKQDYGADSAAVIFDAKKHAEKSHIDLILADTAGRSHTNKNLIQELEKIVRVNKPDLKILVVDSLVGNDVVNQVKIYKEIGFDCIILTKTDVDPRGGTILNLAYLTKKPILYLGTGQNYEDLDVFSPEKVLKSMLD